MGVSIIGVSFADCGMPNEFENSSSVATISCLEDRILEEHAIVIKNNSVVLLQNLLITKCNSTIVASSNLTVVDVRFEYNSGFSGGAIEVNGNGVSKINLQGCSFVGNSAQLHGGAVSIDNSYFGIESSVFTFNTATGLDSRVEGSVGGRGGALYITRNIVQGVGMSYLLNCTFLKNKATLTGGAVFFSVVNTLTNISFCQFVNNTIMPIPVCLNGDCLIRGGAIYSSNAPLRVFHSLFRSNAVYTVEVDQVCALL
jgi:predicted outer membrane repeat protein